MKKQFILIVLISLCLRVNAQDSPPEFITINNIKIACTTVGLEHRKEKEPVIVFESGLGMGGGNFNALLPLIAPTVPVFIYDRNGLGQSEIDVSLDTDNDAVKRLHDLLVAAKVTPPYILVGHSVGGPLIRLFTDKYTEEVVGMVFIDPTDYMLTDKENLAATMQSESKIGYRELWAKMLDDMSGDTNMPEGFRADVERVKKSNKNGFFSLLQNLKPLPSIPVTVLIAYNRPIERYEVEMNARLGINGRVWFDLFDKLRISHYQELIKNNKNSQLVLLPGYSHGIHNQDPKMVAGRIIELYNKAILNK